MSERVPDGWTKSKLSSVAVLEYGKSPNSVKDENGQYPIIGTSGLVGNATDFIWDKTSVVIGRKGTINKPIYINTPFWAIDTTYFCKFLDKTHPKWFFYKICEEALEKHNEASGVPSLSRETLKSIQLKTPPLPEQKKIASILTSVDEVIETTQKQIDKLQDLKKATMNELLTKGIGHTEFKDSALGRIPKSWEVVSISSVSSLITKGATPTTYGYSYLDEKEEGSVRFLRGNNATKSGVFSNSNSKYISDAAHQYLKRSQLKAGDNVISIVGSVGQSFLVENSFLPANINQNVALIRPAVNLLIASFLRYALQSTVQYQIERDVTVQAQPSLSLKQVGEFLICLPNLLEQKKISLILCSSETVLEKLEEKLAQTQSLKKSLMQDLLTGKVRVQVT